MIIAIDGPAGSGKSALGELLAKRLGYLYFDTGVVYRTVTLVALGREVNVHDEDAVAGLASHLQISVVKPTVDDGRQYTVFADGEDVTWQIFSREVDEKVSIVSAHPRVRQVLLAQQRAIARSGDVVMVGRDIGTVVAPEADLKLYLDAPVEVRAQRRRDQAVARGQEADYDRILANLKDRDRIDSGREAAPLTVAEGAVVISTDRLSLDQELELVCGLLDRRDGGRNG